MRLTSSSPDSCSRRQGAGRGHRLWKRCLCERRAHYSEACDGSLSTHRIPQYRPNATICTPSLAEKSQAACCAESSPASFQGPSSYKRQHPSVGSTVQLNDSHKTIDPLVDLRNNVESTTSKVSFPSYSRCLPPETCSKTPLGRSILHKAASETPRQRCCKWRIYKPGIPCPSLAKPQKSKQLFAAS
jgi:hypothetical protein